MPKNWFDTVSSRPDRSLDIIRILVALNLMVHSIYRIIAGDVSGFGQFLGSIGFPLGVALAWLITIGTLLCSIGIIARRLVVFACAGHIIVLVAGIWLDHAADGWFVVGGGRNGMEYSVLLIGCLVAISWSYWPRGAGQPVQNSDAALTTSAK